VSKLIAISRILLDLEDGLTLPQLGAGEEALTVYGSSRLEVTVVKRGEREKFELLSHNWPPLFAYPLYHAIF
jgi:hypothetical protein